MFVGGMAMVGYAAGCVIAGVLYFVASSRFQGLVDPLVVRVTTAAGIVTCLRPFHGALSLPSEFLSCVDRGVVILLAYVLFALSKNVQEMHRQLQVHQNAESEK